MEISVHELKERMSKDLIPLIVDVREEWEHDESRIDNSTNIPLHSILDDLTRFGNPEAEIVVYCRSGARGRTARAVLAQQGFTLVRNLEGGIMAYLDTDNGSDK